jgi:hypothetical protein
MKQGIMRSDDFKALINAVLSSRRKSLLKINNVF